MDGADTAETIARRVTETLAAPRDGDGSSLGEAADIERVVSATIDDGRATIRLQVLAPSGAMRTRTEQAVREAAREMDDITAVEVSWVADVSDPGRRVDFLPDVKHVIAVGSGKGGVGKSTVATNLAVALADTGADVGLLDADVHGPNAPKLLGLSDRKPDTTIDDTIEPRTAHGVRVMSMDFIVGDDDPVIWRGVLVDSSLKQLLSDVAWGSLDYLVVDLPPGTGDAHITMTQHLPLSGVVVVTTPQPVAVADSERTIRGFTRYDVPILGVVENMSRFDCPDCGSTRDIFGTGGARELSEEWDVPVLGRLPLDASVGAPQDSPDDAGNRGIDVPLVGRLQIPQTREEREQDEGVDPIVVRDGTFGDQFDRIATRTAIRVASLTAEE